jgi:hypothetical protein
MRAMDRRRVYSGAPWEEFLIEIECDAVIG